jgi:hypothetical protein
MSGDLISNDLLRALPYLQLVNDAGAGLVPTHLDAWLNVTAPAEVTLLDPLARQFELLIGRDHGYANYLTTVGWAAGDPMQITAVGRAVVRAHEGTGGTETEALVILSPRDPLNLVSLTSVMARAKEGMLVDPYLTDDLFPWLIEATSISRVLLCRDPAKRPTLALLAGAASATGRELEIRCLPRGELHDRYLVTSDGDVSVIGASLNGLHRHFTTISRLPSPGADVVNDHLQQRWEDAEPVIPQTDIRTRELPGATSE